MTPHMFNSVKPVKRGNTYKFSEPVATTPTSHILKANLSLANIIVCDLSKEEKEKLEAERRAKEAQAKEKKDEETLLNQIYYHFRVNPRDKTPDEVAEMALALKAGVEMEINIMEIACLKALSKLFKK